VAALAHVFAGARAAAGFDAAFARAYLAAATAVGLAAVAALIVVVARRRHGA
jgi:hypothetical protein